MMTEIQQTQTMEQMAKEVNLAIKTLKDGTLPAESTSDRSDSNESTS